MNNASVDELRAELEYVHKQYLALQEMLAHALVAAGGEVRINKSDLMNSKFSNKAISIEEDNMTEQFVIRLVESV